ncbi:hypothetical protein [Anabaena azotica]|uniref:hypothetical protein n=1 Tax=Anabaena azotica TaxID=197653 RepID=UPI0039A53E37
MNQINQITNNHKKHIKYVKIAIFILALMSFLMGGIAIIFFSYKPPVPDLSEYNRLMTILDDKPENKEVSKKILDWLQKEEKFLYWKRIHKIKKSEFVELAIINHLQRKAIALRHLKRYSEALHELTKAENALSKLQQEFKCELGAKNLPCKDINHLFSMTYTYFSNVYQDIEDKINAEKYLKLAISFSMGYSEYYRYLGYLIYFYEVNNDFHQALNITLTLLEKAIASKNKEEIYKLSVLAKNLYYQLFQSISWDLKTGQLREKDPRDFMDTYGIGIGRKSKYGMSDKKEDLPTFVAVQIGSELMTITKTFKEQAKLEGYGSVENLKKNYNIKAYVLEQISQDNFEPIVKYLSYKIWMNFFVSEEGKLECSSDKEVDINIDLVKEKLENSPANTVQNSTIQAIEIIDLGNQFLNKYCTKEKFKND